MRDDFERLEKECANDSENEISQLLRHCDQVITSVFEKDGREAASTMIQFIVYKSYRVLGELQMRKEGR